ncbi:hypothetical protein BGZ63DRAFT_422369 [Mariannaea sp. PMI_226]|nr:hypothetical protein BGZ63DRAFT_422369 [Mariannaea sp. PMI_226]
MKNFITCTLAATFVAGAAAEHGHHHHHHARRDASKVVKRDPAPAVQYVAVTETVYEVNGKEISNSEAEKGIHKGEYVIVGETTPTYVPPPPPAPTTTKVKTTSAAAQFYESKVKPAPTHKAAPPHPSAPAYNAEGGSSYNTGSGVSSKFPSGKIRCDAFPSSYGAVDLDWLNFGGYSGIQYVPDYTPGDSSVTTIVTALAGQKCKPGSFCSYACPAGYQKTQWPLAQGSTKESIGGLWCNNEGFLELTRDGYDTLCEAGHGGVSIKNELSVGVATCRTDYPGTENMVIPAWAAPGSTVPVCNPEQANYYQWNDAGTSAQYYINKAGYSVEHACRWTCPRDPLGAGNWAPLVLGVGFSDGKTWVSIFQNLPTSTAQLDFDVEILGGNSKCSFIGGKWTGGASGCTTAITSGQAVVRYFKQ